MMSIKIKLSAFFPHYGNHVLLVGLFLLGVCGSGMSVAQSNDPAVDTFPVVDYDDPQKSLTATIRFNSRFDAELDSSEVVFDRPPIRIGGPPLLKIKVLDLSDNELETFNAMHPLVVLNMADENGQNGVTILNSSYGQFITPFRPEIAKMVVTDVAANQEVIAVDLLPTTHAFCQDYPEDPDCANLANRPPVSNAGGPYTAECAGPQTVLALTGSASHDPDGDPLTYAWTSSCPSGVFNNSTVSQPVLTIATASLSSALNCGVDLTVGDSYNASSASQSATVTIRDTTPPTLTCPANQVLECTGPDGAPFTFAPVVTDICSSSPITTCSPPSGTTFPLGTTTDTCTTTDASGNASSCTFAVQVVDTTKPVIGEVSATPNVLWPANHNMVPVAIAVQVSDLCQATNCQVISVTSNEPDNGLGDGDTAPDWAITGPLTVNLRAERAGNGTGRVYTLTVECKDLSGNTTTKDVTVTVPHN